MSYGSELQPPHNRWIGYWAWAVLGAVLAAWLYPLLAGETLFWGLPALQFYPWRSFAFDQLRAGHLPLWNPYNGGGAPLLANYQTAVFYPPNWLHLVLPHVTAMNLLAVVHLVWAAAGMWVYARFCGLPVLGRGISMLSFALGGYLVARLGSFPTVAVASWMPWMIWAAARLVARGGWRDTVLLSGITAMIVLAGHAQTALYVLATAGLFFVWRTVRRRMVRRGWASLMLKGLAGAGLGVGLAAVQILPTLELLMRSARADGLNYEWATNFSYSLARALTLLMPNFYGMPGNGSYFTQGAYFEDAAYIGLLPIAAAFLGAAAWFRRRRDPASPAPFGDVPFWIVSGSIAFLIALGKNGFLFPLLYRFVPTFAAFQGPVRWLIVTVFSLSVLAGIGVSHAWQPDEKTIFWSRLAGAGGAGVAVIAALVAPRFLPGELHALDVMIGGLVVFGVLLSTTAVLTLLMPANAHSGRRFLWQVAVIAFVGLDLFWAFRGINPTIPAAFFAPQERVVEVGKFLYMPEASERRLKFERFFPFNDYQESVANWEQLRLSNLPNLNMLDRVPMINNFDPIVTQAYTQYIVELEAALPSIGADLMWVDAAHAPVEEPFGLEATRWGALVSAASGVLALGIGVRRR